MKIILKNAELKKPCEDVSDIFGEGVTISNMLYDILDGEQGIGLAANQIGILKKVCVISIPIGNPNTGEIVKSRIAFVNPTIIKRSDPFIFSNEGCLSFPNEWVETIRFNFLSVKDALHPDGIELIGIHAVCAAHEIDHTNGVTMYDRRRSNYSVNDPCPCESGKKFKKCCFHIIKKRDIS